MDELLDASIQMNGDDIPLAHGYPLRLVAGGWPASGSGKWINRISVRISMHDGTKMTGTAYRVPCNPVAPGEKVSNEDMCIIESMPVKSLITFPKSGAMIEEGQPLSINGHAWAGELAVNQMEYSIDFGSSWMSCQLEKPANRLAWQLEQIYGTLNLNKDSPIIVYCHTGVRSAHTTFVLTQLLDSKNVKNYDGSWCEWSYHLDAPCAFDPNNDKS